MRTRSIVVLMLALQLTGCGTWAATHMDPAVYIEQERPSWIRVSLRDGEQRRVRRPTIRGASIVDGRSRCPRTRCRDAIDLDDVTRIQGRKLSVGRTLLTVATAALVGWALAFSAAYD